MEGGGTDCGVVEALGTESHTLEEASKDDFEFERRKRKADAAPRAATERHVGVGRCDVFGEDPGAGRHRQVAGHQVVHMIAMGNLLMAAGRTVAMGLLMPGTGVEQLPARTDRAGLAACRACVTGMSLASQVTLDLWINDAGAKPVQGTNSSKR